MERVASTNSIVAQIQHEFPDNNGRERLIRGQVRARPVPPP